MNLTLPATAREVDVAATTATTRSAAALLGTLLIAQALLAFAPLAILGPAIGWPASLRGPAAQQLAAIQAHAGAVTAGYGVYLAYSVLILPAMAGLAARAFGSLAQPVAAVVVAFAALSTLARAIGILRWLTAMPHLASLHAAAPADGRVQIESLFTALNDYGGGIGEVLGVSLFMAAALLGLGIGGWARGGLPKWLCGFAVVCAGLLGALSSPVFGGPEIVPVAAAVTVLSAWMLAAGAWCLRAGAR